MDVRQRFLSGLASAAGFDPGLLGRPGTVVVGGEDRAGSGAVACYEAGEQIVLWCDPELVSSLDALADPDRGADIETVTQAAASSGLELKATADMRVLLGPPATLAPVPSAYTHRWLQGDRAEDLELVRAFADRSDPDDVEQAALDELDDFGQERGINVLVPSGTERSDELIAYASAIPWPWDEEFSDIGVLVDPDHRRQGLGTLVVGHTVAALQRENRLPLYRHEQRNAGSQRIAEAVGFEQVTSLSYFAPPD